MAPNFQDRQHASNTSRSDWGNGIAIRNPVPRVHRPSKADTMKQPTAEYPPSFTQLDDAIQIAIKLLQISAPPNVSGIAVSINGGLTSHQINVKSFESALLEKVCPLNVRSVEITPNMDGQDAEAIALLESYSGLLESDFYDLIDKEFPPKVETTTEETTNERTTDRNPDDNTAGSEPGH